MADKSKALSERELLFCAYAAQGFSPREAAARAGYQLRPEAAGLRLMRRKEIKKAIARASGDREGSAPEAAQGLRRLAFGGVADAVRLLYQQEPDLDAMDALDLFCVSEIRRKGGDAVEIKFFDRIRALERLAELDAQRRDGDAGAPFYRALEEGARRLGRAQGDAQAADDGR